MTLKELKSIRFLRKRISELDAAIETLKSEMERTTPSMSHAPCKGSECDKRAGQIARMIELKAERREKSDLLAMTVDRVTIWAYTLPKQQAKVIRARYVEGMSWERVAGATGYEKEHCRWICKKALERCA